MVYLLRLYIQNMLQNCPLFGLFNAAGGIKNSLLHRSQRRLMARVLVPLLRIINRALSGTRRDLLPLHGWQAGTRLDILLFLQSLSIWSTVMQSFDTPRPIRRTHLIFLLHQWQL